MKNNISRSMKIKRLLIAIMVSVALLFAGCNPRVRVGELRTESRSVELGDAKSATVKINFGAGKLDLSGGADKLLEADFTYNVEKLKPEVNYQNGTLVVQQPDTKGLPALQDITDFRNEWELHLSDELPMDLSVDFGGGTSDLLLEDLSLNSLNVNLGAGISTIDLSGDLKSDLHVTIDTGAADLTVRLPKDVGVRVMIAEGPHLVETTGLTLNGDAYTNAAYVESNVTLYVHIEAGIGLIGLQVEQ